MTGSAVRRSGRLRPCGFTVPRIGAGRIGRTLPARGLGPVRRSGTCTVGRHSVGLARAGSTGRGGGGCRSWAGRRRRSAGRRCSAGTTTVLHGISELVTNDPAAGPGLLGIIPDAAVVLEGERIAWVGAAAAAPAADRRRRPRRPRGPARMGGFAFACRLRRRPGGGVLRADGGPALSSRRHAIDGGGHPRRDRSGAAGDRPLGTAPR